MTGLRLLREIGSGIFESIRETLPSTDQEAGVFLSGMAWMAFLGMLCLIVVTLAHCRATGGAC